MMAKDYDFVNVYFPPDTNTLLACMYLSLKSYNNVNAIVTNKKGSNYYFNEKKAIEVAEKGYYEFGDENHDIVIISIGDIPTEQCNKAIETLKELIPNIKIKLVMIINLRCLSDKKDFFEKSVPKIIVYNGYPSLIKQLIFGKVYEDEIEILGYRNKSFESAPTLYKLIKNEASYYDIVIKSFELLSLWNKIDKNIALECYKLIQSQRDEYVTKIEN